MKKAHGIFSAVLIILFYFLQSISVYASSYSTNTNQIILAAFAKITDSEIQDINYRLNPLISNAESNAINYINSRTKSAQTDISSFSLSEYYRANNEINIYCNNLRNSTAVALQNQKKKDSDAVLSDLNSIIAAQKAKMQQDIYKTLLPYYMLPFQ